MGVWYDPTTLAQRLKERPSRFGALPTALKDELVLHMSQRLKSFESFSTSEVAREFSISRQTAKEVIKMAQFYCRAEKSPGFIDPLPGPKKELKFEVYPREG